MRRYAFTIEICDMLRFLKTNDACFEIITAFCSVCYLEEKEMAKVIKIRQSPRDRFDQFDIVFFKPDDLRFIFLFWMRDDDCLEPCVDVFFFGI